MEILMMAKIVPRTPNGRTFSTSTKNTGMDQRETLETIIINLATSLGIKEISKATSARGSYFYCAGPMGIYQSASNTILELSQELLLR